MTVKRLDIAALLLAAGARRYLCAVEAGYTASLSLASVRSLAVQGGALDAEACRALLARYALA